jgi:ribosomal protein S18 acetylase RimI-like enzyme
MTTPPHTTVNATRHARTARDAVAALYAQVYAEPPYLEGPDDVQQFRTAYARHSRMPGFLLALAHAPDRKLAGFAYGYLLQAGTTWWDDIDAPLTPDFTAEDGLRTFVVMELAVDHAYRRQGIATRLHHVLLRANPAARITLAARPEALGALAFYRTLGYDAVGTTHSSKGEPVYVCLVRTPS